MSIALLTARSKGIPFGSLWISILEAESRYRIRFTELSHSDVPTNPECSTQSGTRASAKSLDKRSAFHPGSRNIHRAKLIDPHISIPINNHSPIKLPTVSHQAVG